MCVSINRDLTSGASVRPEYSTGNEGQSICVDFSETAPLQRYTASCIVCHVCSRPFWKPHVSISIAYAFSSIRACVAPRVLHFSAFITPVSLIFVVLHECEPNSFHYSRSLGHVKPHVHNKNDIRLHTHAKMTLDYTEVLT